MLDRRDLQSVGRSGRIDCPVLVVIHGVESQGNIRAIGGDHCIRGEADRECNRFCPCRNIYGIGQNNRHLAKGADAEGCSRRRARIQRNRNHRRSLPGVESTSQIGEVGHALPGFPGEHNWLAKNPFMLQADIVKVAGEVDGGCTCAPPIDIQSCRLLAIPEIDGGA